MVYFFLAFTFIYLVSQFVIMQHLAPMGAEIFLTLQLAFSKELYLETLISVHAGGLLELYRSHLWMDLIHPVWYVGALGSGLVLVLRRVRREDMIKATLIVPVLAGFCDLLENMIQIYFTSSVPFERVTSGLVLLSSFASSVKWTLALGALFLIFFLFAKSFRSKEIRG